MIKIDQTSRASCCGCSACVQACPAACITMKPDEEGFLYPCVNGDKCIHCNRCEQVCPVLRKKDYYNANGPAPHAIGGWHIDNDIRSRSSSGGAFTLFAEYVLEQGGKVFGCTLDANLKAVHIGIDRKEDLDRLRGSKYVQSEIGNIYAKVKKTLSEGRLVLFVGTPCQAAGLHAFLGGVPDNLYICDFICHGVPSPKVFAAYIDFLERQSGQKITDFKFRNKDHGWHPSGLQLGTRIEFADSSVKRLYPAFRDSFMNGFLDDLYLRPSCHECAFKSLPKYYASFTIADFWGVAKACPELHDGNGTSLILINDVRGENLFNTVKNRFHYREVDLSDAIKKNPPLEHPSRPNVSRSRFFTDFSHQTYGILSKKYLGSVTWIIHKAFRIVFGKRADNMLQFARFCLVGVTNSAVSYGVNVLTLLALSGFSLKFDYVIGNVMAFLLSVLWAFYWNSKFVFGTDGERTEIRWRILGKTYLSYAFTDIVVNNILSTIWICGLCVSKYYAPLLNLMITVPVNFLLNKFFAHRTRRSR